MNALQRFLHVKTHWQNNAFPDSVIVDAVADIAMFHGYQVPNEVDIDFVIKIGEHVENVLSRLPRVNLHSFMDTCEDLFKQLDADYNKFVGNIQDPVQP